MRVGFIIEKGVTVRVLIEKRLSSSVFDHSLKPSQKRKWFYDKFLPVPQWWAWSRGTI